MPVTIACPHCRRTLDVPDELLGRTVRCQECRQVFTAGRDPETGGFTPPARQNEEAPRRKPRKRRPRFESEPCPYCGEEVDLAEARCPGCGRDLEAEYEVDDRPWEEPGEVRRDIEPHRGGLVLTLGIVGLVMAGVMSPMFCCPFVGMISAFPATLTVPAWVLGMRDLGRMRRGEIDPEGRASTQSGMICGIIGSSVAAGGLLVQLVMIVLYLLK
jgi:hypothetical protein